MLRSVPSGQAVHLDKSTDKSLVSVRRPYQSIPVTQYILAPPAPLDKKIHPSHKSLALQAQQMASWIWTNVTGMAEKIVVSILQAQCRSFQDELRVQYARSKGPCPQGKRSTWETAGLPWPQARHGVCTIAGRSSPTVLTLDSATTSCWYSWMPRIAN